jgi:hypothetical protein
MDTMLNARSPKPETAQACYAERMNVRRDLLQRIGSALDHHEREQAAKPHYWRHAGDLDHAIAELTEVLAFLGGANVTGEQASHD